MLRDPNRTELQSSSCDCFLLVNLALCRLRSRDLGVDVIVEFGTVVGSTPVGGEFFIPVRGLAIKSQVEGARLTAGISHRWRS